MIYMYEDMYWFKPVVGKRTQQTIYFLRVYECAELLNCSSGSCAKFQNVLFRNYSYFRVSYKKYVYKKTWKIIFF